MNKPTHGGKRTGSGRKPRGAEKRVRRSITLEPTAWSKLDSRAARDGVSASEVVNRWALKLETKTK